MRELVHLRGACWLTPEDYEQAKAQVEAAPPLSAEQRVKLRALLRPAVLARQKEGHP